MAQPISGYQWRRLNAAGTVILADHRTVLKSIVFSAGVQAGTVVIHDNASGTAGTALITARNIAAPSQLDLNYQMQNGLTIATTGTNDITVSWG
jgi:hypothetical protein